MSKITPKVHATIYRLARDIIQANPNTQAVLGENFNDVAPEAIALHNVSFSTPDNVKVEISTPTDAAQAAFEWVAEITLDSSNGYKHFLVKPDNELVEAYGRNIVEVDEAGAVLLQGQLETAAKAF